MSLWTDCLAALTSTVRDTFQAAVVYTPASTGAPEAVTAIFDEAHAAVEMQDGQPISTTAPVLTVRLADLSVTPAQGDSLTVDGRTWEVLDVRPDGSGMSALTLAEA